MEPENDSGYSPLPYPSAQPKVKREEEGNESGSEFSLSQEELSAPSEPDQTYFDRPNRWRGPVSTWRALTAEERALAASLEKIQSADLAAHLFNSHALRKAAGSREVWEPPRGWAAWPVDRKIVPRPDEAAWSYDPRKERVFRSRHRAPTSRELLEELIVDACLRQSRERRRSLDLKDPPNSSSTDTDASDESPANARTKREYGRQYPYSDFLKPASSPTDLADDDTAQFLLRSGVRSLVSDLDRLLSVLYITRKHYVRPQLADQKADPESEHALEEGSPLLEATASDNEHLAVPRSRSASPKRRSKGKSVSKPRSFSVSSAGLRSRRIGLRDWSDVLGCAGISGWERQALEKAKLRCEALFGEKMDFEECDLKTEFHAERLAGTGHQDTSDSEIEGDVHVDGFLQPIRPRKGWRGKGKKK